MICGINLLIEKLMEEVKPVGLTLLTGIENATRTTIAVEMAKHVTNIEGHQAIYFSLKQKKTDFVYGFIEKNNEIYIDDMPNISINELKSKCRDYAKKHNLKMVFIDSILFMRGTDENATIVEEWNEIINELKALAQELSIAIVGVSSPVHGFLAEGIVDLILSVKRGNWTYEITVSHPGGDARENVTYGFKDEWGEACEIDDMMEKRKRDPMYAEWEKETQKIMTNPELSLEFEKYERELQIALDRAILLAAKYHSGQRDKQGESYILHPLRVMLNTTDSLSRMTAVLHDILEDTECTEDILREEGIPEEVIENVKCLTRRENEDYFAYINRVNQDYFCKCIKQKDIEDNLRDGCPESLGKRYRRALEILKEREPYYFHKVIKENIDLAYSVPKEDGNVYVYCEQPDETYFFKTAMIRKNDLKIIGHYGFSQEELQEIVDEI